MDPTVDRPPTDSGLTRSAPPRDPMTGTNGDPGRTVTTGQPGTLVFGEYEVIGELGEGGMGRVYKAVDRQLGRFVAVKLLRSADPFEASRFRGEAELIAKLHHPNIVQIFAIDTAADGRPYLVLEFAEGGSLDKSLQGQPQEPRRAAEMVETLARAVQYAHEQGVIHRDLKPANVLRARDATLKLTDFGLAKQLEVSSGMTPSGAVMGTPSYMAPEQAQGNVKELGPATDVYGLGAILYDMLTGRPPFRGVNMVDTLEQVRWMDPAPPSRLVPRLPRDLGTICLKCLRKTPGQRYASAGELAADLRRWLNGETIIARPAPSWERAWRQVRRRPWQAATVAAAGLLVLLLVAGGLYVREEWREREAHARIEEQRLAREHEKEVAAKQLLDAQSEHADKLRVRGEQSLKALNDIRTLVLDGKLSRIQGLGPLNQALFDYYQRLIAEQQKEGGYDPAELADACVKVGDLIRRTGDKNQARLAYVQAEGLYRPLAAAKPNYTARLADVRLKGGRVAFELGDEAEAETASAEARRLWDQLRPTDPTGEATDGAAEARHLQGELLGRQRKFGDAARAYEESIGLRAELAGADRSKTAAELARLPEAERRQTVRRLRDLARGYGYLGDVLLDDRKIRRADRAYWSSHVIRETVVAVLTPSVLAGGRAAGADLLDARQQLARSWGNFALFQTRHRALGTARHFARQALDLQRKLIEASPNTVEYRLDLCSNLNRIAGLNLLLEEPDGTEALLTEALEIPQDDRSAADGYSPRTRGTLAETHTLRALLSADADREQARRELELAGKLLHKLDEDGTGTPADLINRAAVLALQAEFGGPADPRRPEALRVLGRAVTEKQYRERHPDDVRRLRAFKALAGDPEFEKLVAQIQPD